MPAAAPYFCSCLYIQDDAVAARFARRARAANSDVRHGAPAAAPPRPDTGSGCVWHSCSCRARSRFLRRHGRPHRRSKREFRARASQDRSAAPAHLHLWRAHGQTGIRPASWHRSRAAAARSFSGMFGRKARRRSPSVCSQSFATRVACVQEIAQSHRAEKPEAAIGFRTDRDRRSPRSHQHPK